MFLVDFDEEGVVEDFSLDDFSPGSGDELKRIDDVDDDQLYPLNLIVQIHDFHSFCIRF